MKPLVVVISAFLLSTPALAQTSEAQSDSHAGHGQAGAESPSNGQSGQEERKICRRIEGETGNRTSGRRLCLTREEWREFHRQN